MQVYRVKFRAVRFSGETFAFEREQLIVTDAGVHRGITLSTLKRVEVTLLAENQYARIDSIEIDEIAHLGTASFVPRERQSS
jgi:hypothetical protein